MSTYFIAVFIIIFVLSLFLTYILKRNNILNLLLLTGIVIGSTVISIMYPFILNIFLNIASIGFFAAVFLSFLTYVLILAVFAVVLSQLIYKGSFESIISFIKQNIIINKVPAKYSLAATNTSEILDSVAVNINNYTDVEGFEAFEKPVDSEQKIDTIGLDKNIDIDIYTNKKATVRDLPNNIIESDKKNILLPTSIKEKIEVIFSNKQNGDLEGALTLFLEIMETKPEDNLVFWIVPEICLLLKQLGQKDFAKFLLEGYTQSYGNLIKANDIFDFIYS